MAGSHRTLSLVGKQVLPTVLFAAFAAGFLWAVRDMTFEEAVFPRSVAWLTLLVVAPMALWGELRTRTPDAGAAGEGGTGTAKVLPLLLTLGGTVLFVALLPVVGFLITTAVFVTAIARLLGGRLRASVILGLATAVVSTALFREVFDLPLPTGPLSW